MLRVLSGGRWVGERKVGQMLAELQRAAPSDRGQGRPSENHVSSLDVITPKSEYAQTLEQVGISRQTASSGRSVRRCLVKLVMVLPV